MVAVHWSPLDLLSCLLQLFSWHCTNSRQRSNVTQDRTSETKQKVTILSTVCVTILLKLKYHLLTLIPASEKEIKAITKLQLNNHVRLIMWGNNFSGAVARVAASQFFHCSFCACSSYVFEVFQSPSTFQKHSEILARIKQVLMINEWINKWLKERV